MTYEKVCTFMSNALTKMGYKKHVEHNYFYLGTQHNPAYIFCIEEHDMGFVYTSYGLHRTSRNYSFKEIKNLYEKAKEFLEYYKHSMIQKKLNDLNEDFVC